MILFGVRSRRKRLGTATTECPQCHKTCSQAVARLQRWFTLFFIPVIPFSTRYYAVCSMCSGATKLDRAEAERLSGATVATSVPPSAPSAPDGALAPPDGTAADGVHPPAYGANPSDFS
jgi:hypothetical protein